MVARAKANRFITRSPRYALWVTAAACLGLLTLLFTHWVLWGAYQCFLRDVRAWVERHEGTLQTEIRRFRFGSTRLSPLTLDFGPLAALNATHVRLDHAWPATVTGIAEQGVLTVQGPPMVVWERWNGTHDWAQLPLAIQQLSLEYSDKSSGHVLANGVTVRRNSHGWELEAKTLFFNRAAWSDVALTIDRPKTALIVQVQDKQHQTKPIELRYVRSDAAAAEWFVDIPMRPLTALLSGLSVTSTHERARVSGVVTIVMPDDLSRTQVANGQFILDNWFIPNWPEAKVIAGNSGSIGIRMNSTPGDPSWTIGRVEVAAGLFTLLGNGRIAWGTTPSAQFSAKGQLNCAQLSANLPDSTYRTRIRDYLLAAPGTKRGTREGEHVELSLAMALAVGQAGTVSWHLTQGCGLSELSSKETL